MKRLSLLLIVVLVFCSACSNALPDDSAAPPITDVTPPQNEHAVTLLTADEARDIAQTWLDERPEVLFSGESPNVLEHEARNMAVDGEDYYLFYLDNPEAYWFSILVHTETGVLLHRFVSDGEFPEEEIEPLDDWYNRYYVEDTQPIEARSARDTILTMEQARDLLYENHVDTELFYPGELDKMEDDTLFYCFVYDDGDEYRYAYVNAITGEVEIVDEIENYTGEE